ncbi:MAG: purine-binding chemotaxis protein CheW [Cyanothece sp. SIO1E1]|nr:purine-binding chemotaxis protein CheW [Cyanothece sp. SIO1E1]
MSDVLLASDPLFSISDSDASEAGSREQFLRFNLATNTTALLSIIQLTEVLKIPIEQIVPIPHMPAWVMGIYNWRGEILWMVDLGHLIGQAPWHQATTNASTHTAMVIQSQSGESSTQPHMLGLIVNRVEDIEWCDPDLIQSPPAVAVATELAPFLRGYWVKTNGEMLSVLDGPAIIDRMPKPNTMADF